MDALVGTFTNKECGGRPTEWREFSEYELLTLVKFILDDSRACELEQFVQSYQGGRWGVPLSISFLICEQLKRRGSSVDTYCLDYDLQRFVAKQHSPQF